MEGLKGRLQFVAAGVSGFSHIRRLAIYPACLLLPPSWQGFVPLQRSEYWPASVTPRLASGGLPFYLRISAPMLLEAYLLLFVNRASRLAHWGIGDKVDADTKALASIVDMALLKPRIPGRRP